MRMYIDWFDTEGTSTVYRWHHRPSHLEFSRQHNTGYLYMYWKTLLGIAKEFASRNHQIRIHLFVNSARPTAEHIHISVKSIELYNKSKCVSKLQIYPSSYVLYTLQLRFVYSTFKQLRSSIIYLHINMDTVRCARCHRYLLKENYDQAPTGELRRCCQSCLV